MNLPIIVKRPQWRNGAWLTFWLVILVTNIANGDAYKSSWLGWIINAAIVVFMLNYLGQLMDVRPRLKVTDNEIFASPWNMSPIAWSAFRGVSIREDRGVKYVCLELRRSLIALVWLLDLPIPRISC